MHYGWVPPTLNIEDPDDGCDLDYLASGGRALRPRFALSNSFGFGGINACIALRAPA
jgi:3-oxoacyl-(acyl-carrier-protein) synthase